MCVWPGLGTGGMLHVLHDSREAELVQCKGLSVKKTPMHSFLRAGRFMMFTKLKWLFPKPLTVQLTIVCTLLFKISGSFPDLPGKCWVCHLECSVPCGTLGHAAPSQWHHMASSSQITGLRFSHDVGKLGRRRRTAPL